MEIAQSSPDPTPTRVAAATTAFALASTGVALAVWAFIGGTPPQTEGLFPNGRIVFLGTGAQSSLGVDNTDIFAIDPETGNTLNLTNTSVEETEPVWSQNGNATAFTLTSFDETSSGRLEAHKRIVVKDATGSHMIRDCGNRFCNARYVALSPDGIRAAFILSGSIFVANTRSGQSNEICDRKQCGRSIAELAWSPDGRKLIFAESAPYHGPWLAQSSIFVADVEGSSLRKITNTGCPQSSCPFDHSPQWSPDGTLIAFGRAELRGSQTAHTIHVMGSDGSNMRRLDECVESCSFYWGPDSRQLAVSEFLQTTIRLISVADGKATIIDACRSEVCRDIGELAWSPDGRRIAFLAGGAEVEAYVANVDGSGFMRIEAGNRPYCCLQWLPDTPEVAALLSSAVEEQLLPPPTAAAAPVTHPQSLLAFMGDPSGGNEDENEIFTARADGSHLTRLTNTPLYIGNLFPSWSADGTKIYFQRWGYDGEKPSGSFIMNADGSDQRPAERTPGGLLSPDESRIAVIEDAYDRPGLLSVMNVDGSARRVVATVGPEGSFSSLAWSPDGSRILFGMSEDEADLFVANADGTGLHRISSLPGSEESPAWSPDGSQVVFTWRTFTETDLYIINADGSGLRRLTDFVGPIEDPAWSPDGTTIAFYGQSLFESRPFHAGIYTIRTDGSGLFQVTPSGNTVFTSPVWQPLEPAPS